MIAKLLMLAEARMDGNDECDLLASLYHPILFTIATTATTTTTTTTPPPLLLLRRRRRPPLTPSALTRNETPVGRDGCHPKPTNPKPKNSKHINPKPLNP